MSIKLGKGAAVKLETTTIGEVFSFAPALSMETVDNKSYGDEWAKPVVTVRSFTVSIEGHLKPSDASQASMLSEVLSAGDTADPTATCKIENLRFYEDDTYYWCADTDTDSDAHMVITSFSYTPDLSGLIAFSAEVQSYGPIHRTS